MGNISYAQMRIMETADSFRKLYYIYRDKEKENVVGEHLLETANLLEEISGMENKSEEIHKDMSAKMKKILKQNGIGMDSMQIYYKKNGRMELAVRAKTIKNRCVQVADMAKFLSTFFARELAPSADSRMFIVNQTEEFVFEERPEYFTITGIAACSKDKGKVSGDSYSCINNQGGRTQVCICDGMGTGAAAARTSSNVVEILEKFFEVGFSEKTGVKLVNSAMAARGEDNPFTLDVAVFDLYEGKCSMIKLGAMASYVKSDSVIKIIKPSALPAGIFENTEPDVEEVTVADGDYVVMLSDGVMDALPFYDKEQQMGKIIEKLPKCSPKLMAEHIMEEIIFYLGDEYKDDMTVMVTGIWKA